MNNRRIFVASNGFLGTAPESARQGDVICILEGSDSPCLLRRKSKKKWALISGDCFVFDEILLYKTSGDWSEGEALAEFLHDNMSEVGQFCIC